MAGPPPKKVSISLYNIAILLLNVHRANKDPKIGFLDANQSIETLTNRLNKTIFLDRSLVESALWSSNMLDENNDFWHPTDESFEDWTKQLLNKSKYNRYYGTSE